MNLLDLFRRSRSGTPRQAHMTWSSRRISHTASRAGMFLKKEIWIWPIIAVVVLSVVGFGVRRAIETTMKQNLSSQLQTLLSVETAMIETWLSIQMTNSESMANDLQVRENAYVLLDISEAHDPKAEPKPKAEASVELQKNLAPSMTAHKYVAYFVADKSKQIVAASQAELVSRRDIPEYDAFLSRALAGETVVSNPFGSVTLMKDEKGNLRTGVPTMFVCAPIRDTSFQVVGVLALRIRPEMEFTRILQLGQFGATGETYAFNKAGLMVSNSRFDDSMILNGILPDTENAQSILNVSLRDPQGNLNEGFHPALRRSQLPLTRMAADAVAGNTGIDLEGYRDYRGVPVVGTWTWLPKFDLGVATEIDVEEAFRPLYILQWALWSLYGLLILGSVAIFIFTVVVSQLRREAQKAVIEAQQLGQYTLEEKLGSGAMGVVYRGHHSMLRRPTAIKLLNVDNVTDDSVRRFEREVQITSQLNHPNTVAIYDYGRTPEGVFYYAMEYLDGIDLQTLVDEYGPQPEHRIVHILLQICGSLFEAHSNGLVHRDIKPANVMLNRRGCQPDFVKILDFGLVKALDETKQANLTSGGTLTGTPLYMSPESIESPMSVDARSDLYAVGAVGYFLLTGEPVFSAGSIIELCQRHVDELPVPPSERVGKEVSREFEHALLACLEKSRAKRPQTARDLAQLLSKCPSASGWSIEEADAWWSRRERGVKAAETATSPAANTSQSFGRTIIGESN